MSSETNQRIFQVHSFLCLILLSFLLSYNSNNNYNCIGCKQFLENQPAFLQWIYCCGNISKKFRFFIRKELFWGDWWQTVAWEGISGPNHCFIIDHPKQFYPDEGPKLFRNVAITINRVEKYWLVFKNLFTCSYPQFSEEKNLYL